MRLLEQARSHVASAVSDSKSTPLDQQKSESSNTPVEQQRVKQALLDFQEAFPGVKCRVVFLYRVLLGIASYTE